jgi:Derlin-2/3
MPMTLEQWYRQMPVVTRSYLTLSFLTTAGCALELISPFSVYYNSHLIFRKYQLWRLFTNFFFFGSLGMDFVFHMFFLARYCRLLEEGTFRGEGLHNLNPDDPFPLKPPGFKWGGAGGS